MVKVCVLKSGGEFTPRHVRWLAGQTQDLVCLSDVPVDGVETVQLEKDWPGWWSKMELFSGSVDDDLLFFDLDTVIVGEVDAFSVSKTTMLTDFYRPKYLASGLMYIAKEDKPKIWREFTKDPQLHMLKYRRFPLIGDQGFLNGRLDAQRWQDVLPGKVVSYKAHCRQGVPDGVSVVCFHGKPRPWDISREWIPPIDEDQYL